MIIAENKQNKVVTSHNFDSVNCTIDAEDMRYVASLLRNNYSNTQLAVVREISANALDANLEANSKRNIEVTLPSKMNTNFCVRDFGNGLSQEDVFGLYSKYGKSTKRSSNNYIGAFGIGKFAPLSYGDNFTCVSFYQGTKTSYNIFVDENDDTKIVKLHEEKSSDPTGLSIEVAISNSDIDNFRSLCKKFFKFFTKKDMPKFLGAEKDFVSTPKILLESRNDSWFFVEQENSYYYRRDSDANIIMGRVSYPINFSAIDIKNYVQDIRIIPTIESLLRDGNFYLRVPLGCVKLHHSRESLEYNKPTQKFIVQLMVESVKEIQELAREKLADSEDLFEAKSNYAKIVNSLPRTLQEAFKNCFSWKDISISSPAFHRPHAMCEDLIITQTDKESDSSVRDGFRVKSVKTSRLFCQDDCLIMIQDIESSHGNNLRARTLFSENPDLKVVYTIFAKDKSARSHMKDEWHFDCIDKKHLRYSSKVEKQKPLLSGLRKSNGSRADIQLFEMRDIDYIYRNVDYWKSVDEDISKLQGDKKSDGLVDGKFIYVPIKNFKIDIEGDAVDLSLMHKRMLFIRTHAEENSQEKSFRLFGVRSGDVSKLDSDCWVSIKDFYVQFAKNYLKQNLKQAKKAYKVRLVNDDAKNHEIMNFQYDIGKIFNCNSLRLTEHFDNNHILCHMDDDMKSIMYDNASSVCVNLVNYLSSKHKDWLQFNLDSGFTAKQFYKDINSIKAKYPMLKYACTSVNTYGSNDKETNQDIINYIKDCDKI